MVTCTIWLILGLLKDMATLQTWIGQNATRYHNLNDLPLALPCIISYFSRVWGLFASGYRALPSIILKNVNIHFFVNLTVAQVNLQQIAPKPCWTERKCIVAHVVMRWSYGNALHYDLSILNWEKMYGNACGNAYSNALKLWQCIALWPIHVLRVW